MSQDFEIALQTAGWLCGLVHGRNATLRPRNIEITRHSVSAEGEPGGRY
jgi:hypothetical protein